MRHNTSIDRYWIMPWIIYNIYIIDILCLSMYMYDKIVAGSIDECIFFCNFCLFADCLHIYDEMKLGIILAVQTTRNPECKKKKKLTQSLISQAPVHTLYYQKWK